MKLLMVELKEYLKEKGLKVNARKFKIMRFGKRVGKSKKGKWKRGKDEIEEIKKIQVFRFYLAKKWRDGSASKGKSEKGKGYK